MSKLKIILIAVGIILVGGVAWSFFSSGNGVETFTVKRVDLVRTVSVTGKTKAVNNVDLGFSVTGEVVSAPVKVGDKVVSGQVLAVLDQQELRANLLQAEANRDSELAKLEDLKNGASPEDLAVTEAKLSSAVAAEKDAENNLRNKIADAYTKSDDAIRNTADQFLSNPLSTNPQLNITISNSEIVNSIVQERPIIEGLLVKWQAEVYLATSLELKSQDSRNNLSKIKSYLDVLASGINTLTATASLSQSTVDAYKLAVSTARSNINTAIVNLQTAEEKWNDASNATLLAKRELDLKKAGSTTEAINSQAAKVKQYEAQMATIKAQLSKTVITSPINGLVTKQDAKVGQVAVSGTALVSVISNSNLEIEAYVPEINIGKVSVGNDVLIDFDAFPDENFSGKLIYIDPAETIIDGIVNFKVKISIEGSVDARLKSGLTSNLRIISSKKEAVLVIPEYSIVENGDSKYVESISSGDKPEKVNIKIGISGDGGLVEVVSGLNEGDTIVAVPNK